MDNENIVRVNIGSSSYSIKTDEPAVNVQRAAADLDRRIAGHIRDAGWMTQEKALVLTAVELADRYLRLKDEVDGVNARFRETSKQLFEAQGEVDSLKRRLFELKQGIRNDGIADEY